MNLKWIALALILVVAPALAAPPVAQALTTQAAFEAADGICEGTVAHTKCLARHNGMIARAEWADGRLLETSLLSFVPTTEAALQARYGAPIYRTTQDGAQWLVFAQKGARLYVALMPDSTMYRIAMDVDIRQASR